MKSDRTQPINLRADHIRLDQRTGASTYFGHVVLQQGSLEIQADTATASYKGGVIDTIRTTGKPVRFHEQPTRKTLEVYGSALNLSYMAIHHILLLQHQVMLHQGPNSFTSAEMRYNLVTQVIHARGNPQGGHRVHAVLMPEQSKTRP